MKIRVLKDSCTPKEIQGTIKVEPYLSYSEELVGIIVDIKQFGYEEGQFVYLEKLKLGKLIDILTEAYNVL